MAALDEVNFEGVYWRDIDWRKPIHQMEVCNCCRIPAGDYIMGGHISACYYLNKNQETPAARAFLVDQIREALRREGRVVIRSESLIASVAKSLTPAQRAMVVASEPDDINGYEGVGVELHGQAYQTAKALEGRRLGRYTHGSFVMDMYWNTNHGLLVRDYIRTHGLAH